MKNIQAYNEDTFEFHQKVVKSKHNTKDDPTYKQRLDALSNNVKSNYIKYDKEFASNSLGNLRPEDLNQNEKKDLISLYKYSAKPFQELKLKLTTDKEKREHRLCPNCTINNINTFDHIIPKTEFSEFVDNPKNLMPCCSECNSNKSSNWREGNNVLYLNLYLDDLPNIQYLFVETDINETIVTKFCIENRNNIDANLYRKIQNHYSDLKLCERFSGNSADVITELQNSIKTYKSLMTEDRIKDTVKEIANGDRIIYGYNYWKAILKLEIVENENIYKYLLG